MIATPVLGSPQSAPSHWPEKAFPGKPNLEHWGWHNGTTYQKEPVYSGTPAYVKESILDESTEWGANFLNVYPTYVIGGPQVPMSHSAGDPIPNSWATTIDPNWDVQEFRDLIRYAHDRGVTLDCFTWMTNDPNRDYWEWLFRETGNVLRDGVRAAWDGFEEEYYNTSDGSITERVLRYQPGAFTAITPGSWNDIPSQTPPLFLHGIMCAMGRFAGTRCAGQTDQPLQPTAFGWLGGAAWQPTAERPYLGFQADSRFLKPRSATWGSWGVFGGGNHVDAFLKQANDFARRRLSRGDNSSTALWWLNESSATTPSFLRTAIYGISQDPVRTAVTTRLITTGSGGVGDLIVPGKASYSDRWDTAILQNNYLRVSRYASADRGKLSYDRDVTAHFDSHSNAESTTDNVDITTQLFRTDAAGLAVSLPSDPPLTLGTQDGSNAEFSSAAFPDAVSFDLDSQSASEFPGLLSESLFPSRLDLSFTASVGYHRLRLRTSGGALYAWVLTNGEVIGFLLGTNDVYFNVTEAGPVELSLWCDSETDAGVDFLEIERLSKRAVRHDLVEEAGYVAVLEERLETVGDARTLSETRTWTALSDTPYHELALVRSVDSGSESVDSVIGCEGYDRMVAGGATYSSPQTLLTPLPSVLRFVASDGSKPEFTVFVLDPGSATSLVWAAGELRLASLAGPAPETQRFAFAVTEGIYSPADEVDLALAFAGDRAVHSFGAGDTITLSNPLPVPIVQVVELLDTGDAPVYVRERGFGQAEDWWMFRGTQGKAGGGSDFLRVHLRAGGTALIRRDGRAPLGGVVRPGWGCQHLLAIRDDFTSSSATVEVLAVTPVVNAPRVEFTAPFDSVTLNGADWRYFDEGVVFLPNRPGTYSISVALTGEARPRLISTDLLVTGCRWNEVTERLVISAALPDWYGSVVPAALTHRMAVLDEELAVASIDNGGRVAPSSEYRMSAADRAATFDRGRYLVVNPGTTRIDFRTPAVWTGRVKAPLGDPRRGPGRKLVHLDASAIDPSDTTREVRIEGSTVYVKNWEDQGFHDHDASQPVPARQPRYVADGVAGLPAVEFDGTNDHLEFLTALVPSDGDFSAFFVFDATVESVRGGLFSQYTSGAAGRLSFEANSGVSGVAPGTFYPFINGTTDAAGPDGTSGDFAFTKPAIFEMTVAGGTSEGGRTFLDGALQDDFTLSHVLAADAIVGAEPENSVYFDGRIAEVLVYDGALTDAERDALGSWLAGKYGIASSYGAGR